MATQAKPAISVRNLLPLFDRLSAPTYGILGIAALVTATLGRLLGYSLGETFDLSVPALCVFIIAIGAMLRRAGHRRIATCCETIALVYLQGVLFIALLIILTGISAPFADAKLVAIDRAFGFDWLALVRWSASQPTLLKVLDFAYRAFVWESLAVFTLLAFLGAHRRSYQAVLASLLALCFVCLIYPFCPAEGGFVYFGLRPADFAILHSNAPWEFAPVIHKIKGGAKVIEGAMEVGLVSFPSYHCAAAIILTWAVWRTWLRIPALLLNSLMIFAALIFGAHYLIDVIGGAALAAASLPLAGVLLSRQKGEADAAPVSGG